MEYRLSPEAERTYMNLLFSGYQVKFHQAQPIAPQLQQHGPTPAHDQPFHEPPHVQPQIVDDEAAQTGGLEQHAQTHNYFHTPHPAFMATPAISPATVQYSHPAHPTLPSSYRPIVGAFEPYPQAALSMPANAAHDATRVAPDAWSEEHEAALPPKKKKRRATASVKPRAPQKKTSSPRKKKTTKTSSGDDMQQAMEQQMAVFATGPSFDHSQHSQDFENRDYATAGAQRQEGWDSHEYAQDTFRHTDPTQYHGMYQSQAEDGMTMYGPAPATTGIQTQHFDAFRFTQHNQYAIGYDHSGEAAPSAQQHSTMAAPFQFHGRTPRQVMKDEAMQRAHQHATPQLPQSHESAEATQDAQVMQSTETSFRDS